MPMFSVELETKIIHKTPSSEEIRHSLKRRNNFLLTLSSGFKNQKLPLIMDLGPNTEATQMPRNWRDP